MKKFCSSCNSMRKCHTGYTVGTPCGVKRKNECMECGHQFYTTENETDKIDFLNARKGMYKDV